MLLLDSGCKGNQNNSKRKPSAEKFDPPLRPLLPDRRNDRSAAPERISQRRNARRPNEPFDSGIRMSDKEEFPTEIESAATESNVRADEVRKTRPHGGKLRKAFPIIGVSGG